MTEFNPPIAKRDTDELISIAHGTTEYWNEEAIKQAKMELQSRGVTLEYQRNILQEWQQIEEQLEKEYHLQLEENAIQGYSRSKMVYIFLVAPFILTGKWRVDMSIGELKEQNFKRKIKQRLLLLLSGTIFWIACWMMLISRT